MYSAVASKPSLHIYKIHDRSGLKKVAHQNLLLQVNSLPLPTTEFEFSIDESACDGPCSTPSQSVCDVAESMIPVNYDLSHADSLSVISHIAVVGDHTASCVSSHSSLAISEAQADLSVIDLDTATSAFSPTVPFPTSSHDPVVDNNSNNRYTVRLGRLSLFVGRLSKWLNSKLYLTLKSVY